jgi:hypothetical protein
MGDHLLSLIEPGGEGLTLDSVRKQLAAVYSIDLD